MIIFKMIALDEETEKIVRAEILDIIQRRGISPSEAVVVSMNNDRPKGLDEAVCIYGHGNAITWPPAFVKCLPAEMQIMGVRSQVRYMDTTLTYLCAVHGRSIKKIDEVIGIMRNHGIGHGVEKHLISDQEQVPSDDLPCIRVNSDEIIRLADIYGDLCPLKQLGIKAVYAGAIAGFAPAQ